MLNVTDQCYFSSEIASFTARWEITDFHSQSTDSVFHFEN